MFQTGCAGDAVLERWCTIIVSEGFHPFSGSSWRSIKSCLRQTTIPLYSTTKQTMDISDTISPANSRPLSFLSRPKDNNSATPTLRCALPGKGGLGRVVLNHEPTGARADVYLPRHLLRLQAR